jgi:ribosomal protein S18 acetylase RimI-like enzyme
MPAPLRLHSALDSPMRDKAVDILFEYMAMTQGENGYPVPDSIADLPASLRRECEQPERSYAFPGELIAACIADDVVGCVGLRPLARMPGTVEVKRLYVRPSHRRCGIARSLMASVHNHTVRAGFTRAVLSVMPSRTEAIAFYRQLGYTDCAPFADWPLVYLERPLSA